MVRWFLFAFMMFYSVVFNAQTKDLTKGFKALELKNYGIAKSVFEQELSSFPSLASFGLFKLYFESKDFYSLDSASSYLNRSRTFFEQDLKKLKTNHAVFFDQIGWSLVSLDQCYQQLGTERFNQLKGGNDVSEMTTFLESNKELKDYSLYQRIRDSLWVDSCNSKGLFCWMGLKHQSPNSDFIFLVNQGLHEAQFTEWNTHDEEGDFSTFLLYHPNHPMKSVAEDEIFRKYEQSEDSNRLKLFIATYPLNRNISTVWKSYFRLSSCNYSPDCIKSFLLRHPNYPYRNELEDELASYTLNLFPCLNSTGKYGFMDEKGKVQISERFENVEPFFEGLSVVSQGDKFGAINKLGKVVVSFDYDFLDDFHNGLAIFNQGENWGLLNRVGKVIWDKNCKDLRMLFSDVMLIQEGNKYGLRAIRPQGLVEESGKVIVDAKFDDITPLNSSYALVNIGSKYGVINSSGYEVIPVQFDEIVSYDTYYTVKKDAYFGILDPFGKELVPIIYDQLGVSNNQSLACRKNKEVFFYRKEFWKLFPLKIEAYPNWQHLADFRDGQVLIKKAKEFCFLDTLGKTSKPLKLQNLKYAGLTLMGVDEKSKKVGVVSRGNKLLIPFDFDDIELFNDSGYLVRKNGMQGMYNFDGKCLLPCSYDQIKCLGESEYYLIEVDQKFGLASKEGSVLLEPKYDRISIFNNEYLGLETNGNILYFNRLNKTFIQKDVHE